MTQQVGLVGWPVAHSLSPAMHNAAFQALGLDWRYGLLPVPAEEVGALLHRLRAEGYRGANVTVPHKQAVMPFVDGLDDEARAIGAVNTLVARHGRWTGHNTDAGGFLAALGEVGLDPAGRRALVLGAGGAARAVVYALARAGCAVAVHNRTPDRAARLVDEMDVAGGPRPSVVAALDALDLDRLDLVVNATSLGLGATAGVSPWPETLPLPAHWTVLDTVYNPAGTRLLARARAGGAACADGLAMLVHQGALSFSLWTGLAAPLDVMRAAALHELEQRA